MIWVRLHSSYKALKTLNINALNKRPVSLTEHPRYSPCLGLWLSLTLSDPRLPLSLLCYVVPLTCCSHCPRRLPQLQPWSLNYSNQARESKLPPLWYLLDVVHRPFSVLSHCWEFVGSTHPNGHTIGWEV